MSEVFLPTPELEQLAQVVSKNVDFYSAARPFFLPKDDHESDAEWRLRLFEVVSQPLFQARLEEIKYEQMLALRVTPDSILAELSKVGFSNMADFVTVNDSGDPVIDLSGATRQHFAAISEVSTEVALKGEGECQVPVKQTKIKFHNKLEALKQASNILGIGAKKVELSGPNGGPIEVSNLDAEGEAAKRALADLIERNAATATTQDTEANDEQDAGTPAAQSEQGA